MIGIFKRIKKFYEKHHIKAGIIFIILFDLILLSGITLTGNTNSFFDYYKKDIDKLKIVVKEVLELTDNYYEIDYSEFEKRNCKVEASYNSNHNVNEINLRKNNAKIKVNIFPARNYYEIKVNNKFGYFVDVLFLIFFAFPFIIYIFLLWCSRVLNI